MDNSRQMSMSAPGAINAEVITTSVRFEDETITTTGVEWNGESIETDNKAKSTISHRYI